MPLATEFFELNLLSKVERFVYIYFWVQEAIIALLELHDCNVNNIILDFFFAAQLQGIQKNISHMVASEVDATTNQYAVTVARSGL